MGDRDDVTDFSEAVVRARPATAANLRKLAAWAAGEATRTAHAPTQMSSLRIAQRYIEEADWIEFQLGCGTTALTLRRTADAKA